TFSAMTGSDGEVIMQMMARGGAKVADIPVTHTVIHDGSEEEARKYFSEHGFTIRESTYAEKVPDLMSLKDSPEDMKKLREAYKGIKIWVMSVKDKSDTEAVKSREFQAEFHYDDNSILTCSITGRLDTITAASLLTGFNENKSNDLKEIIVDLEETEYISSAGLRVLLMMCKSLSDSKKFHIINYSENILEILNVTGFSEIFGI
ncbi:MAG: STAS domain-containing protein, partial [Lachnospiraceae bacterium]|nr:STAS domain-containing protein [Lachnospiraceae bacterium]